MCVRICWHGQILTPLSTQPTQHHSQLIEQRRGDNWENKTAGHFYKLNHFSTFPSRSRSVFCPNRTKSASCPGDWGHQSEPAEKLWLGRCSSSDLEHCSVEVVCSLEALPNGSLALWDEKGWEIISEWGEHCCGDQDVCHPVLGWLGDTCHHGHLVAPPDQLLAEGSVEDEVGGAADWDVHQYSLPLTPTAGHEEQMNFCSLNILLKLINLSSSKTSSSILVMKSVTTKERKVFISIFSTLQISSSLQTLRLNVIFRIWADFMHKSVKKKVE